MWEVESIEVRNVELDFSSSGLANFRGSALYAGEDLLVNAVELVDFSDSRIQVLVCESCGITHCEPGGWIVMRRFADSLLWCPNFSDMSGGSEDLSEYNPPSYLTKRGIPIFRPEIIRKLRLLVPGFPELAQVPPLSPNEVGFLLQWQAPNRFLGSFPSAVDFDERLILATDPGGLDRNMDILGRTLRELAKSDGQLVPEEPGGLITFWLDLPGTPEWSPIAERPDGTVLVVLGDELHARVVPGSA